MGFLDELLSQPRNIPSGGFQWDEAQQAEEARQEAAKRLARARERPSQPPAAMVGQEAIPYSMGMLSPMGMNWPQTPVAQPQTAPDMPPSTNDPTSREPVLFKDGIPLPRPRPSDAGVGQPDIASPMSLAPPEQGDATLPLSATPTIGTGPPTINNGPPGGGDGILGKISNPANAPMLMAMGGGFAGAPSFGSGLQRGFSAAAPQAALLRKEQLTQDYQNQTVRALVAKGIPPDMALAAATNPEILKQLIPQAFGAKQRKFTQIGEGMAGDKQYGFVDEASGKVYGLDGKEIGSGGEGVGTSAGGDTLLAKGVKQYNSDLKGPEYLAQFSPEMQAAIRARQAGDKMPTSNPRMKGFNTKVDEFARKYGEDIGEPINDASYTQKRNLIGEFGKGTPSSLGGQRNSGGTAVGHLETLAKDITQLKNWSLPGGVLPDVASMINWVRTHGTEEQKAKVNAVNNDLDRYVAEVAKFYSGSSGGGVYEREAARQRFNTNKTPAEFAAAISSERDLFHSKLMQLQEQADSVLGEHRKRLVGDIIQPHAKESFDKLQEHLDVLRGNKPSPSGGTLASAPAMAPGKYVFDPATGQMVKQ